MSGCQRLWPGTVWSRIDTLRSRLISKMTSGTAIPPWGAGGVARTAQDVLRPAGFVDTRPVERRRRVSTAPAHRAAQKLDFGTPMPGSTRVGPEADGATSKSKMAVGMYTVEQEFGMSTTPESRPSI